MEAFLRVPVDDTVPRNDVFVLDFVELEFG